jgi:hypothetical protein
MPLALIGVGYGIAALRSWGLAVERGWFLPLMTLASLANLTLTALLLRETWRRRALWLAPLFLVNLAMVFALQRIARIEPRPCPCTGWSRASPPWASACCTGGRAGGWPGRHIPNRDRIPPCT